MKERLKTIALNIISNLLTTALLFWKGYNMKNIEFIHIVVVAVAYATVNILTGLYSIWIYQQSLGKTNSQLIETQNDLSTAMSELSEAKVKIEGLRSTVIRVDNDSMKRTTDVNNLLTDHENKHHSK
ncbi:MAG: hypothetical protein KJ620_01755 [Candidatus Edwardsbacteria bacterium]|nr:hypothetical protein [Candidatus Edwardsbacteria bacterium]MBU1575658.1 hypothetical protein [Candidatus Edwardsbacteria bacterium]MBU2463530.1 hypothetical protein [Candidatus Edwardsbacteria bacterium]